VFATFGYPQGSRWKTVSDSHSRPG